VLVTGSRTWRDKEIIAERLGALRDEHGLALVVIHGGDEGADLLAYEVCQELGIDQIVLPANWKGRTTERNGKKVYWAGPYRNQMMLDYGKPELCLAFHPFLQNSKGTRDMVDRCRTERVPVEINAGRTRVPADMM